MKKFSALALLAPAVIDAQSQPTFPDQYSCASMYTLNGSKYGQVTHIDQTNQETAVQKIASSLVSFFANKTKYSISTSWCSALTIYGTFATDPPMSAAYQYIGSETVGGVECDKFGEDDQYADHIVYFKKGTWTPVQVYDKQQEQTGMLGGLTHYSNCVEGKNATAYDVPASCFN